MLDNNQLITNLYKKRLNKHMYIPYLSAHPLRVKKAFVKAERTWITLICSAKALVAEAEYQFRCSLYRRGHPDSMLEKWFKLDLKPREKGREPMYVLPSVYNPVWEYVNVREMQETFLSFFRRNGFQDEFRMELILSLRRNRNLFDLFKQFNLTILQAALDM
ncbi:hypothetical protein HI914_02849 [Erysiphe necator]|nr:hypothetical protein HI914_02849 [Erysiphe necator]